MSSGNVRAIAKRVDNLEQTLSLQHPGRTPLFFLALPYKDHRPDETCQCINPNLTDRKTHYLINYHILPGIHADVDALIERTARELT